jgi:hypothetical protein
VFPLASVQQWLDFISQMTSSLAWPGAVCVVVFLLRNEIRSLIPALESFKAGPVEARFRTRLGEASEKTSQANLPSPEEVVVPTGSPRDVVIDSWLGVEEALTNLAASMGINVGQPPINFSRVYREILRRNLVEQPIKGLIEDLRVLRNQAVHDRNARISDTDAQRYAELANRAIAGIEDRFRTN